MTTTLHRNDVVRTETGIYDFIVLSTFANDTMAVIAEITPAGAVDENAGCAHSVATMHLVKRAPETVEAGA